MPMKNPPHPGESIFWLCLEPLDLSVADAAAHLDVDEEYLAALCEGRGAIDADMANRLEQAFGGTADVWMRMQASYDLAQRRLDCSDIQVKPIESAA